MSILDKNKFTEIEVLGEVQYSYREVDEQGNTLLETNEVIRYRCDHTPISGLMMDDKPEEKPHRSKKPWGCLIIVIILAAIIAGITLLATIDDTTPDAADPNVARIAASANHIVEPTDTTIADTLPQPLLWSMGITEESVNDVPMTIYSLGNIKAELIVGQPETTDSSIVLITQAADIRKDNNKIVGDFILRGEQIATGKRKVGYCAIINNIPSIGMSDSDEMKDFCIVNNGDYFRQYILVSDAELQINKLRGKSLRRALANNGDSLYVVISHNRESLYDFSLALQDIGMTNALYLVGGESYFAYRTAQGEPLISYGEFETYSPYINYIIFRHK